MSSYEFCWFKDPSLIYKRFTASDRKDRGITRFEFVAKDYSLRVNYLPTVARDKRKTKRQRN